MGNAGLLSNHLLSEAIRVSELSLPNTGLFAFLGGQELLELASLHRKMLSKYLWRERMKDCLPLGWQVRMGPARFHGKNNLNSLIILGRCLKDMSGREHLDWPYTLGESKTLFVNNGTCRTPVKRTGLKGGLGLQAFVLHLKISHSSKPQQGRRVCPDSRISCHLHSLSPNLAVDSLSDTLRLFDVSMVTIRIYKCSSINGEGRESHAYELEDLIQMLADTAIL